MTNNWDAHNLMLIEKQHIDDWAGKAIRRLYGTDAEVFIHRDKRDVLMPLWFIARQAISYGKEKLLVLDYIKKEWWFKDAVN